MIKGNKRQIKYIVTPILALFLCFLLVRSIPVSAEIKPSTDEALELIPGGISIGVKVNTKVLVVGFAEIITDKGAVDSPALLGNILVGDIINEINGIPVDSSKTLMSLINKFQDKKIKVSINRKGEQIEKEIVSVKSSEDNKYKLGLWVRDSTAGVGTLTFYNPKTKVFAALGHPITDVDTNEMLKINSGSIVNSSIISVKKGQKGVPGELKGIFVNEEVSIGEVLSNTNCGIFGKSSLGEKVLRKEKPLKVASPNEIKEGRAQIITTVDEEGPKYYDIEILKLLPQEVPDSKSMLIKIIDERLLNKTGGIVQGMSGSPIIQNNKIVGAVTHVLINKPDTGYGIYIHWMVKDANNLSK